jgi:hypothetical protein
MPLNRAPRPDELPPEYDPDRLLRDLVAVAALIYYSNGDITPLLRRLQDVCARLESLGLITPPAGRDQDREAS